MHDAFYITSAANTAALSARALNQNSNMAMQSEYMLYFLQHAS